MISKACFVMAVVGVVLGAPADPYNAPADPYSAHAPAPHSEYKEALMPYNFQYGVKDDYSGADFGQNEESDGKTVHGSYTVQLPDGRKQTVTYTADHYNGYQADVSYYGEAQYPHEYGPPVTFAPQYSHQEPSYQPQEPSYQAPQPSYSPPKTTYN